MHSVFIRDTIEPDDEMAAAAYEYMINATNVVNLTTFDKNDRPRYIDEKQAKSIFEEGGAIVLDEYSDAEPDIVIAGCGDIVSREAIEAIRIIKQDLPEIKIRFVYVGVLSYRGIGTTINKLSKERFSEIFTNDKPIIANFHGYPETLENILENYTLRGRLRVHGFNEEGSTTTPFEMLRRNAASRYDIAIDVARIAKRDDLITQYNKILEENHSHAIEYGEDFVI